MPLSATLAERRAAKIAYNTQRQQRLRDARHAAGLCVACGKRPPMEGAQKCRPCTVRASQAQWRYMQTRLKGRERRVRGWNFETDALITEYVPLARQMARRVAARQFSSSTVDRDDLLGDALYGLVVAGRTYDASYKRPFKAWAATQIRGAIYEGIRRWYRRLKERPVLVPLEALYAEEEADYGGEG